MSLFYLETPIWSENIFLNSKCLLSLLTELCKFQKFYVWVGMAILHSLILYFLTYGFVETQVIRLSFSLLNFVLPWAWNNIYNFRWSGEMDGRGAGWCWVTARTRYGFLFSSVEWSCTKMNLTGNSYNLGCGYFNFSSVCRRYGVHKGASGDGFVDVDCRILRRLLDRYLVRRRGDLCCGELST